MKKLRNIVLHMGPDKTGSTAIQEVLSSNAVSFEQLGVLCSPSPYHNDKILAIAFSQTEERAVKIFHADKNHLEASEEYLQMVREKALSTAADTLILSYEGLVHLNQIELIRLYSFLQSLADKIHVVLYARSPESYATSAMCQRVKTGRRAHLKYPPVLQYMNFMEPIISVFGRECIDVRLFDQKIFPAGDVVLDFLSMPVLIMLQKLDRTALVRTFKGNPSFSQMGLLVGDRVVEILGGHAPYRGQFKALFADDLYLLKGQKIVLAPSQVRAIEKQSARHTKFLEQEFNIVFSDSISKASNKLPDGHTSWQIELMARDLIARKLPNYHLSMLRLGWRHFLCWGSDVLSGSN